MGLGPRLDLRQSQSLVMTPQLQQAIKLLALTNMEVEAFIAEELEKNPLLDANPDEERSPAEERDAAPDYDAGDAQPDDFDGESPVTADRLIAAGDAVADAPLDVDYASETFHHDGPTDSIADGGRGLDGGLSLSGDGGGAGGFADDGSFESILSAAPTLHEHLSAQVGASFTGAQAIIAHHLIDQIDEAGYLVGGLPDVAERLGAPLETVEAVLARIQSFDPTGVGARSLAECLALQAREADRHDPAMARLLDNLELLARGEMGSLRRICGVDQEDLVDMIRELRAYNPKPGLLFGSERVQAVVPDVFVARTREGWAVELNSATLPRVLVNRSYYVELARGARGRKDQKAFLTECLASANWLVKALDQRARTITRVATELVKQQEGFFDHGVSQLRPLTLKAIAEEIGMHESTVSRVTSNKYLSCARGVFELKYFFTSAIQTSDGGDAVSALAVKNEIKALIGAEDARDILSDDKLVELLRDKGFDIARRTVAKYREALSIGSSVQRRRAKILAA
jgi:RNA polymerase sigma-54 factor